MTLITFEHVRKQFPGVTALDDVSFSVEQGECHALLGENGAGKSTLGKVLAGIYPADGGRVLLNGQPVAFASPREALAAGVGIVHQELVFCPNLSVAENLCLHDLPRRWGMLDRRELRRRARMLLGRTGLEIDVDLPMSRMSIAQEQLIQIAAAVGLGAKVLVFDEPTSSLGQAETERLFLMIRQLQAAGTTIIYVSHRLDEIFALCQRVSVLRDGKHVATKPIGEVTRDDLVQLMVGRAVEQFVSPLPAKAEAIRLRVRHLTSPGKLSDVSFDVNAGEIVGLAGLVGAGRSEIAMALNGLDPQARGSVEIDGRVIRLDCPRAALRAGLALIPEDRKRQGLVLSMSLRENLTLPILHRFRRWLGWADRTAERRLAQSICDEMHVRTPTIEASIQSLSGGNQQKIVLAKGIAANARVLIVDEPTRGVDVGAKREIHEQLAQLATQGKAILVISSDLPELLSLSHRVLVVREGKLEAEFPRKKATPEAVLRGMAGVISKADATTVAG